MLYSPTNRTFMEGSSGEGCNKPRYIWRGADLHENKRRMDHSLGLCYRQWHGGHFDLQGDEQNEKVPARSGDKPVRPVVFVQQDNNRAHTSKLTVGYIYKCKMQALPWPPQPHELNIINNLWIYLKRATHAQQPEYLTEGCFFCCRKNRVQISKKKT